VALNTIKQAKKQANKQTNKQTNKQNLFSIMDVIHNAMESESER
jgi:hypothetical protein